jgi:hypothetical protein
MTSHLLGTFDLGRIVRIIGRDIDGEDKGTSLIETYRPSHQPQEFRGCISPYSPSSGVRMILKLRRSAASGNSVFMVDGKSNSVKSVGMTDLAVFIIQHRKGNVTFLYSYLSSGSLGLLLVRRLLILLDSPDLRS